MATWIISAQSNDFKRALEMAEDQRKRGYTVWIQDENGGRVDEPSLKHEQTNRSLREIGVAAFFLLVPIIVGIGGLYLIGVWVDRVW
jgi:hypothetical protein